MPNARILATPIVLAALAASLLAPSAPAAAGEQVMAGHISMLPAEIKWVEAPATGPGAQMAVLEGDLKQAVPFTFRLRLPPDFRIAPHTHPIFERVTVLSGTFHLGIGETFEPAKARAYPAGGVTMMPPGMPMFAFAGKEGTTVQIHGTGPWGITYLNPADDPRNK